MRKNNNRIIRYIWFVVGVLLLATAYNFFILPNNVVSGVSGVGVILNHLFDIDPALVIFIGSIILLFLSLLLLGKNSTKNTIVGTILYPFFVKLTADLPSMVDLGQLEQIVEIICGSIAFGVGTGLVFKAGFTTGGTDILNKIISKYFKMTIGKAMLFTQGLIILSTLFIFDFQTFIYSIISIYIYSIITDKVILGISQSKAFYIITSHETAVKKFIMDSMAHGVTVLDGRGGFTGDYKKVIMCIIPTNQYYSLKEGIGQIDKDAFFVVTDAYEVSGGA